MALGLCAQMPWTRTGRPAKHRRHKHSFDWKETRSWALVAEQAIEPFRLTGADCRPWLQFDRGGDVGDVTYTDAKAAVDGYAQP